MFSRIWLVNAVLAIAVAFLGLRAYEVWFQENKGPNIPEMAQKPIQRVTTPLGTLNKIMIPPESEYGALMRLNLFSPERTEILADDTKQEPGKKAISPTQQKNLQNFLKKIILYGMVITDDSAEALVSNPVLKPVFKQKKRPGVRNSMKKRQKTKQTKWVKAGDAFGEFQVVAIKPDRVLLKAGDQSYDLLLYDKEKVRSRGVENSKTGPTVVGTSMKTPVSGVKGQKTTLPSTKMKRPEVKAMPSARIPETRANIETQPKKRRTGGFGRPMAR